MTRAALLLAPLWLGCRSFDSVDDACKDSIRGDQHGSDEANAFFGRVTCYRRYAGLSQASIQRDITEAAEAHAAYLETNGVDADWPLETIGEAGFTGETSFERIEAAGFPVDWAATFVWEVLAPTDETAPRGEIVDLYLHAPLVRDVLLAPGWEGGGYAELDDPSGRLAYFHVVLPLPSNESANKPVLYPVDGQEDVPISVPGGGGLPGVAGVTGYPITLTFGSVDVTANPTNPLDVTVYSSLVTGPSGPVEHTVFLPGLYDTGPNYSTAVLLPTDPLEPNATYTVTAEVGWVTNPSKSLEWSFTTGEEAAEAPF